MHAEQACAPAIFNRRIIIERRAVCIGSRVKADYFSMLIMKRETAGHIRRR